jgi:hypothetical protein
MLNAYKKTLKESLQYLSVVVIEMVMPSKSEIFYFGEAVDYGSRYKQLFGCKKGSYPFRYLGIPIHYRKLNNKDWETIDERIEKKLSS